LFAIAFCTFLLENQTTIFANIMKRTASQILDATDPEIWVMDPQTEYWEQTKPLKDTDLTRVRGVSGVQGRPPIRPLCSRRVPAFYY
jgi:putative ABC transport system permease protein